MAVTSLTPSPMSALATGWLHIQADGLADRTKSYSFFPHKASFSASFSLAQIADLSVGNSITARSGRTQENSLEGPLLGLLPRDKEHKCAFQETEQLVVEKTNLDCQELRATSEHRNGVLGAA